MTHSTDGLCRITTSDGIRGIGLGRGAPLDKICKVIQDVFKPLLIGENPIHTQYLWDKLHDATLDSQGRTRAGFDPGAVRGALCAVDLALWDIKGKAAGMSICELLGGKPHPVLGYIQKGFYVEGQSLEEMAEEAVTVLKAGGFTHLKMRVGRNGLDEAEDRVAIMRKALGDDVKIMVDVNGAWNLEEALEGARRLAPYDLLWLEEPMGRVPRKGPKNNYDWNAELGRFQEKSPISLAAGENHMGLAEFWELITKGKPRYMQLDIAKRSGGLSEWVKVQPICQAAGILMAPHVAPQFHVQVVAAAPNGFIIEICDNEKQHPAWPDLYHGFPEVKNGHMECPTAPGWGMEINDDMVKNHGTVLEWDFDN
jgi:D-arabinonate dehydratase